MTARAREAPRLQLSRLVSCCEILDDRTFRWFGRVNSTATALVDALAFRLYEAFYVCGAPSPWIGRPTGPGSPTAWRFDVALRQRVSSPDADLLAGGEVPRIRTALQPGFFTYIGTRDLEPSPRVLRFYWNIYAGGVLDLATLIERQFSVSDIPYRLKVLRDPAAYDYRTDAAVLYVGEESFDDTFAAVAGVYPDISSKLGRATPAFTKWLAPGIGFADDPLDGQSFGEHRCGLTALALIRAWREGLNSEASLEAIFESFRSEGLSTNALHLNPGATDPTLDLRLRPATCKRGPGFLDVAHTLATQIVKDSIWSGDQCTWVAPQASPPGVRETIWGSLGPDLYGGTAGIAFALGEIARRTGDHSMREAALGAARHSLLHANPATAPGLFDGAGGIALVAAYLGKILESAPLVESAQTLARFALVPSEEADLMGGLAGSVLAGLALAACTGDASHLGSATRLGTLLVDRINLVGSAGVFPLTGLAHGASGGALALAHLGQQTGNPAFTVAAERCLDAERNVFDAVQRNWPDLRPGDEPRSNWQSFATTWCHGAPGVGIVRAQVADLWSDGYLASEARIAFETTARYQEAWLASGNWSWCFCHGLAGNASALAGATAHHPAGRLLAERAARIGIREVFQTGRGWPCGLAEGTPPTLMNGLAGVALFYAALDSPTIRSVLEMNPSQWKS